MTEPASEKPTCALCENAAKEIGRLLRINSEAEAMFARFKAANDFRQRVRSAVKRIKTALPTLVRDSAGLAGISLISYGSGCVYRPAGFIVAGLFMLVGAILDARARASI